MGGAVGLGAAAGTAAGRSGPPVSSIGGDTLGLSGAFPGSGATGALAAAGGCVENIAVNESVTGPGEGTRGISPVMASRLAVEA